VGLRLAEVGNRLGAGGRVLAGDYWRAREEGGREGGMVGKEEWLGRNLVMHEEGAGRRTGKE